MYLENVFLYINDLPVLMLRLCIIQVNRHARTVYYILNHSTFDFGQYFNHSLRKRDLDFLSVPIFIRNY